VTTFLAIVAAGVGSYLTRAIFIIVLARRRFPPLALRALSHVAPAVLGALVVSLLLTREGDFYAGLPEAMGLLAAVLVAWRTRNLIYTLVAAMGVLWILSA
jgi:branched-subunit amino acid transport protein